MTPKEAKQALEAADQNLEIIRALGQRGSEYKKAWESFAEKFELPKELPHHGCGVFRPKDV